MKMKNNHGYRLLHRKGRSIQIVFEHMPGVEVGTGTKDDVEAIRIAERMMREFAPEQKPTTLGEFAKGFFSPEDPHGYRHRLERRNVFFSDAYFKAHQARLDNYIIPAHGKFLLSSIRKKTIETFILDLISKRTGKDMDDSTKNKVLTVYRIILDEAVEEGYIDHNPAKDVPEINEVKGGREPFTEAEMDILFPADDEDLIRIWGNLTWATYFAVQKDTGWRPGEAAALSKPNFFPHMHGTELNGVYTEETVSWTTHKIVKRIKTSDKANGAKSKQGFVTEQTARLLARLGDAVDGDYYFALKEADMPKSHRKKDHETQYIYAEFANDRLAAAAKRAGVELNGRTQYSIRHAWNTYYYGRLPEMARLILMGHSKNRPEYTHLTPLQMLERVLNIKGFKEAMGVSAGSESGKS